MVDARCDAVGSEERPFWGSFQKGGGARNGAEPRSLKGGHARGALSSLLVSDALSSPPSSSLHGSCALVGSRSLPPRSFPRSWPGAACWWRRGREAPQCGLWWTCMSGRGVPERARRPRGRSEPGATTPTVVGGGTRRPLREVPSFLLFLYGCCGAVSVSRNCLSVCAVN